MPVISFKVDAETDRRIRDRARAEKISLSAYLRKRALGGEPEIRPTVQPKKHPVSGLPFNAAKQLKLVSEEDIKAALVEFP